MDHQPSLSVKERLEELEARVQVLERTVAELRRGREEPSLVAEPPIWLLEGREPTRDELIAWLEAHGMPIARPTPEMRARARRWRELPEERRQALQTKLNDLNLLLSEIIIQNRR